MERFTLNIELGNDAMQTAGDIAQALLNLAERFVNYGGHSVPISDMPSPTSGALHDANGNRIGTFEIL